MWEAIETENLEALEAALGNCSSGKNNKSAADFEPLARRKIDLLRNEEEPELRCTSLLRFLDFCVKSSQKDLSNRSFVTIYLTDLVDISPLDHCIRIFEWIENNCEFWNLARERGDVLVRTQLLRVCNELLRRVSRTTETELCGRILVFLARRLPLTEKSGLNMTSQFNTDNVTCYDQQPPPTVVAAVAATVVRDGDGKAEEMEEGEMADTAGATTAEQPTAASTSTTTVANKECGVTADYALYVKFWQLQSFFSSPLSCYDRVNWKRFQHNTQEVLNAFTVLRLEDSSGSKRRTTTNSTIVQERKPIIEDVDAKTHPATTPHQGDSSKTYFAKYLTSQKLFQLQLNDSQMRRYILVQFLVLFQYLQADVKFKDKTRHKLVEEQLKWIDDTVITCYRLLSETSPNGSAFSETVKNILMREEYWNDWKNAGCDDFTKRQDKTLMQMFKKRPRQKYHPNKIDLGNTELTRLWNLEPDNLAACRKKERQFEPSLLEFLSEPLEQADPDGEIEPQYKLVYDENFQWRALRLMYDHSKIFMTSVQGKPSADPGVKDVISNMGSYLEELFTKNVPHIPELAELEAKREKERSSRRAEKQQLSEQQQLQKQEEKELQQKALKDLEDGEVSECVTQDDDELDTESNSADDPPVTESQLGELASLIAADWVKFAKQLDYTPQQIKELKKKEVPEEVSRNLLEDWTHSAPAGKASTRRLRNLLLEAELFNEDVAAVLSRNTQESDEYVQELSEPPVAKKQKIDQDSS